MEHPVYFYIFKKLLKLPLQKYNTLGGLFKSLLQYMNGRLGKYEIISIFFRINDLLLPFI